MKTPLELAIERARAYVRDRGWWHEPLSWEEVAVLADAAGDNITTDYTVGYRAGFEDGKAAGVKEATTKRPARPTSTARLDALTVASSTTARKG